MQPDDEGFLYPVTEGHRCNDCGICRLTCPVNMENSGATSALGSNADRLSTPSVFAAWHLDEIIREESSSGGVFTALAENILARGGAVVGAAFDGQLVVRHTPIESPQDLHQLRGSKYVQSEIAPALYQEIRDQLKRGRPMLFSGTPCQVAGLRAFLRESYRNLFCCDVACMGVPSPALFKKYVDWKSGQMGSPLVSCEFRNKVHGWQHPSVLLHSLNRKLICERGGQNPYYLAFGYRIALRPACYCCSFKGLDRQGDLTIADFWGVERKYPEYNLEDKGTSLVIVNTVKGQAWLANCNTSLFLGAADQESAIDANPMLVKSASLPPGRDVFYRDLKTFQFSQLVRKYRLHSPTALWLFKEKVRRAINGGVGRLLRTTILGRIK